MQDSISKVFIEKYGSTASPGVTLNCPFCGKSTFSINRDDTLGRCFDSGCGRYVTRAHADPSYTNSVDGVLESMFYDFHVALLAQQGAGNNAFAYLVGERGIHQRVVIDSMLGAVPPGYDIEGKFAALVKVLEDEVEAEKGARKSKRSRPKKGADLSVDERLTILRALRDNLASLVRDRAGWVCFFYTDPAHRITAIRLQRPYSDETVTLSFRKSGKGLFGHGLFSPRAAEEPRLFDDPLIVTEGEFSQLQLQSLAARCSEAAGREPRYLSVCAVGSVEEADLMAVHQISPRPIICCGNDAGGVRRTVVERARWSMHVIAFAVPAPHLTLDSFIRSFGSDCQAAWNAVMALVRECKPYLRRYEGVAKEIFWTRQQKGTECQINTEVAQIMRNDLGQRGKFYNDGPRAYFFFETEKKLIAIDPDDDKFMLTLNRYGVNGSERLYRYLLSDLRAHALEHGTRTEVHRLAYYDSDTFMVYLFNNKNQIYRISPDAVDLVDNGTDGVLFLTDAKAEPFERCELNGGGPWLDQVLVSKINFANGTLAPCELRLVFTLWFYSLFFESIMPTKPILAFIGPKGSGKSITLRKVGILLFGKGFDVTPLTNDSKDFDAAVTNAAFVAVDNADSRCDWLDDKLATVATGGSIKKRELYTTNKLVEIPARCFLAITSRTPRFRRDDVADRLLIMPVERFSSFSSEKALLDEVARNRDCIMSEIILHLQEIVRALRDGRGDDCSGAFRMADFADFAAKVARQAGTEEQVKAALDKLTRQQSVFTLEADPVFELLQEWVPKNAGREVSNADLCKELAGLADKSMSMPPFPYKDKIQAFAQHMKNLRPDLEQFFSITKRRAHAGKTLFRFTPKADGGER